MDLIELPDFEKRADSFIKELNRLHEQGAYKNDVVSWSAEKILPDWTTNLDMLQTLIGDSNSDFPELKEMADQLDAQSANCCVVEVRRITDFREPLESFVQKVLVLAALHKAQIDTSLPFSTEGQVDFIEPTDTEADGRLYRTMINFKFQ